MRKQPIVSFFDWLAGTPTFVFLCGMLLCGAIAGGMTGLYAQAGENAVRLASLTDILPEQVAYCLLYALGWLVLPLICGVLPSTALLLSGVVAARGYTLGLTAAVSLMRGDGLLLSLGMCGIPALLNIPALLAACTMVWQNKQGAERLRWASCRVAYLCCIGLSLLSGVLRIVMAVLLG